MRGSFASKVRTAAQGFRAAGKISTPAELAEEMRVQTYEEKKRVYDTVLELVRTKDIQRVSRGVYTYAGKPNRKPPKQKIMWNYFRMRMKCGASVTIEELQAAAKVSAKYAQEWLSFLSPDRIRKGPRKWAVSASQRSGGNAARREEGSKASGFTQAQTRGGDSDPG